MRHHLRLRLVCETSWFSSLLHSSVLRIWLCPCSISILSISHLPHLSCTTIWLVSLLLYPHPLSPIFLGYSSSPLYRLQVIRLLCCRRASACRPADSSCSSTAPVASLHIILTHARLTHPHAIYYQVISHTDTRRISQSHTHCPLLSLVSGALHVSYLSRLLMVQLEAKTA